MSPARHLVKCSVAPLLFLLGFTWLGAAFVYPYLRWLPLWMHGSFAIACFVLFSIAIGRSDHEQAVLPTSKRLLVASLRNVAGLTVVATTIVAGVYEDIFVLIACLCLSVCIAVVDVCVARHIRSRIKGVTIKGVSSSPF